MQRQKEPKSTSTLIDAQGSHQDLKKTYHLKWTTNFCLQWDRKKGKFLSRSLCLKQIIVAPRKRKRVLRHAWISFVGHADKRMIKLLILKKNTSFVLKFSNGCLLGDVGENNHCAKHWRPNQEACCPPAQVDKTDDCDQNDDDYYVDDHTKVAWGALRWGRKNWRSTCLSQGTKSSRGTRSPRGGDWCTCPDGIGVHERVSI